MVRHLTDHPSALAKERGLDFASKPARKIGVRVTRLSGQAIGDLEEATITRWEYEPQHGLSRMNLLNCISYWTVTLLFLA